MTGSKSHLTIVINATSSSFNRQSQCIYLNISIAWSI